MSNSVVPLGPFDRATMKYLGWVPSWSSLRSLGRSRIVSLTAIAPFLGSLILFNEQVVELVRLGAGALQLPAGDADHFTLTRLKLTYLGLVALGIGSFSFLLVCPTEIKHYENLPQYIERELPLISNARHRLLLAETVETYFLAAPHSTPTAAYPESLYPLFHSFVDEVIRTMRSETDTIWEGPDAQEIITMTGNVNTDAAAYLWHEATPPYRGFLTAFEQASAPLRIDLLSLRYGAADHSRPYMRALVTICFGLGFVALSIPTIQTFALIAGPPIKALFA